MRPLPFTLRLRPASAAFFGGAPRQGAVRAPGETAPLARVFVLERAESGGPEIERLPAAAAFRAVLTHGYCFSIQDRVRNAAMVQQLPRARRSRAGVPGQVLRTASTGWTRRST